MEEEIERPLFYNGTNDAFVGNYMVENRASLAESIVVVVYSANIMLRSQRLPVSLKSQQQSYDSNFWCFNHDLVALLTTLFL